MITNTNRLRQFINGITGVSAGAQAIVNMPCNVRYHELVFQCTSGTSYTSAPTGTIVSGGTPATFTTTIATLPVIGGGTSGQVTSIAIATAGSGQTPGTYAIVFSGGGGTGVMGSATVNAGGTVTAAPFLTATGGGGPIDPRQFFTSVRLQVAGITMRDISPAYVLAVPIANGYNPSFGEFPIFFTEPWRNESLRNDETSWDTTGQGTFQITFGISPNVASPVLQGVQVFDGMRNLRNIANPGQAQNLQPFLSPISQHTYTFNLAAGRNPITTLPFNYPIQRMWVLGSTPGNIYQLEVYQDKNLVYQAFTPQMQEETGPYTFTLNPTGSATTIPNGIVTSPFDVAYIPDPDQRLAKSLSCASELTLVVYSNIAQTCSVLQELKPPAYA
jgi:hypothetical protein